MPVSPLLKWMYKVFLLVVKNSSLITKLVTPLIDRVFNTINDEFKRQGLDQVPGIEENLASLKLAATSLRAPVLVIPSITDPKVLAYIKKIPKDVRQQKYNEISGIESNLTNIIIQKNKFVTEINKLQAEMLKYLAYVDEPIDGLGISLPTLIDITQTLVTILSEFPYPQAAAAIPVLPPSTLGSAPGTSTPIKIANKTLDVLSGIVEFIRSIGGTILKYINIAKGLLNVLDSIITPILNILAFLKALLQLDLDNVDPNNLTQDQQNKFNEIYDKSVSETYQSVGFAVSEFTDISNNPTANQALETALVAQLQPNSINPYTYKGFILTLENDPNNKLSFSSRRVKSQGTGDLAQIVLYNYYPLATIDSSNGRTLIPFGTTGSYSYSATTQILVNEAQLIIDQFLTPPPSPGTGSINTPLPGR